MCLKAEGGAIKIGNNKPSENKLYAFDLVHPVIQLGCFAGVIAFSMLAIHPVFISISFVTAFSFSVYARGWRKTFRGLAWQIPLVFLVALINPLFSSVGSTELFRIGNQAVYLESLAYGAFMGLLFISVMLWFSNASQVLSSDKVMLVFGNIVPTIGLMVSMALRLVPQFVERGKTIDNTTRACSAALLQSSKHEGMEEAFQKNADRPIWSPRRRISSAARLASVLMAWSMEDSLETADSMRARGWGASKKRTSYKPYRPALQDAAAAVILVVLAFLVAVLVGVALSQYHFYPNMSRLVFWWGYIPYTLFMALPLLLCLLSDFRWWRLS